MSEITKTIKDEVLKRCEESKQRDGYDFWNDHIKFVVENALMLAEKFNADKEIVELSALLHDISMPSNIGTREEHHIYGAEIAQTLLRELNYPEEKIEKVKNCILKHRGSVNVKRDNIEEECVADADVIAHFNCIPSLFSLAFSNKKMSIIEGTEFVKQKLERDFNKLSDRSKILLKDRFDNIMQVLFNVNNS